MRTNKTVVTFIILIVLGSFTTAFARPVQIIDANGNTLTIQEVPSRIVSLVPSATETLVAIKAGQNIAGITYHDLAPLNAMVVGGFFEPSLNHIRALQPDMIIISDIHTGVKKAFTDTDCILLEAKTSSLADSMEDILLLGKIFNREAEAERLTAQIQQELALVARKIDTIPPENRKRVIRLMGRDAVMTPGVDSFQNQMIQAAGGIPHHFDKKGDVVPVTKEEWIAFNPQVIYGCGGDRKTAEQFFRQPGWKDVAAVQNHAIYYFPCDLTCRAATHTGYFVSWLAAAIYGEQFSAPGALIEKQETFAARPIEIDLDYIKNARILYTRIHDFPHKTLVIRFTNPLTIVSTLDGEQSGIRTIGNHFSPPQYWAAINHADGLEGHRKRVYAALGQDEQHTSFLFTGADMDNLAMEQAAHRKLTVHALVTAGVRGNAMRMAKDEGLFYEPGTINTIIMTNMQLTPRAMTRAIITATEAKTAALMDMDIRSSYGSGTYRATGTGTDNILVVSGTGKKIDCSGGHTKLGELIARTVYAGVQEAVRKQNRLTARRNLFQRLKERDITIYGLIRTETCDCGRDRSDFTGAVEALLLDPRYRGFIESALALQDDYNKGLVTDLTGFTAWGHFLAEEIAGREIPKWKQFIAPDTLEPVLDAAFTSLLNGVYHQELKKELE